MTVESASCGETSELRSCAELKSCADAADADATDELILLMVMLLMSRYY